ncbi:hypothetical protein [Asticcacaulis sp. EMRT-3]|uniref:hypothetical protein n=1 Tax=Asticcacaulis sp. EMRT-3 TaxID=3040349 RepID=UPI0024AEEF93|nr:hypothetical protein [Asticcacaulis sp. EMRT-3]MDI7774793.1 hypothetical protein [Asticcacaulis sp. EMRT-3]
MLRLLIPIMTCGLLFVLAGCHADPAKTGGDDDAALRAAGYSRAPQVTGVEQGGGGSYIISGNAMPDGRVRVTYGGDSAIGVTADAKGHFRAPVPSSAQGGGLYDLSIEDNGRLMHAEGRLFIPPQHPEKATLIRAGAPSLPLFDKTQAIAVIDYDAAGAIAISGHLAVSGTVDVLIDGDIRAQIKPDARHAYSAVSQIAPPGSVPKKVEIVLQPSGQKTGQNNVLATRTLLVSLPETNTDNISALADGWRVDSVLPGGGMQTTLVF